MDYALMRERLIKARVWMGYNRKVFAEELGIPYRTVTNYENGSREAGSDYLTKVADFCCVTTDWLLGLSDDPRNDAPSSPPRIDGQIERLSVACRDLNDEAVEKVISYALDLFWNPGNRRIVQRGESEPSGTG